MNLSPLTSVYALTLTASDGRERKALAYLPTEEVRQQYYERAKRNGLSIVQDRSCEREIKGLYEPEICPKITQPCGLE